MLVKMQAEIHSHVVRHPEHCSIMETVKAEEVAEHRLQTLLADVKQLAQRKNAHCQQRQSQTDS